MVLADTSVWISHLRRSEPALQFLLENEELLMHPFVAGELACGNLKDRDHLLRDLRSLPRVLIATDDETSAVLERHQLWGKGLGWVDAHLLTSSLLTHCRLWTLDARLAEAARNAGVRDS